MAQDRDNLQVLVTMVVNEPSRAIICMEFLDYMGSCYLVKNAFAAWKW